MLGSAPPPPSTDAPVLSTMSPLVGKCNTPSESNFHSLTLPVSFSVTILKNPSVGSPSNASLPTFNVTNSVGSLPVE